MNKNIALGLLLLAAAVGIAIMVYRDPRLIRSRDLPRAAQRDPGQSSTNTRGTSSSLEPPLRVTPLHENGRAAEGLTSKSELPPILQHFADTNIPITTRIQELEALGQKGDAESRVILMALGNARIYANRYAVDALGYHKGPDVTTYLSSKLSHSDALVLCAAIRALARSAGTQSIPALARVFSENRTRHDGHEEMVRTAAAAVLGKMGDVRAIPILSAELNRSEEKGWSLAYGSALVTALRNIGTPQVHPILTSYADRLTARLPNDPLARKHFETKIAETRAAASGK